MSASFSLTNAEVVRAVLQETGLGSRDASDMSDATEADVRAIIRSGLRRAFFPEFNDAAYQWRWREKRFSISAVDVYDTGTVEVADGEVTLTDGTWPDDIEDYYLKVDGHILFVTGQDELDSSIVTISHTQFAADSGSSYAAYKYQYDLPSDFGEWMGPLAYTNGDGTTADGTNQGTQEIFKADSADLVLRYAAQISDSIARAAGFYAITSAPDADGQKMLLWPVPQPDAYIEGVYLSVPEDNLATDLTTPGSVVQVGPAYAEAFLEAILTAAEEYNDDTQGVHAARYERALRTAILHDRAVGGAYDFGRRRPDLPHVLDVTIDWSRITG